MGVGLGECECRCLRRPEGTRSPGAVVLERCQLTAMGAVNQLRSPGRTVHAFNCRDTSPAPNNVAPEGYFCLKIVTYEVETKSPTGSKWCFREMIVTLIPKDLLYSSYDMDLSDMPCLIVKIRNSIWI